MGGVLMPEKWFNSKCMDMSRTTQIESHLQSCSVEQLEDELAELMLNESDSDEILELIDAYIAELDKRSPSEISISAEQSLQKFHQKYTMLFEGSTQEAQFSQKQRCVHIARYGVIAAIIVIIISLFAVQVSGVDWFESIVHWTSETFGFTFSGYSDSVQSAAEAEDGYKELRNALESYNITAGLVPTYLPEGYRQVEFYVADGGTLFTSSYQLDDNYICIQISEINSSMGHLLQKDAVDPELYIAGDVEHYIITNIGAYSVIWENSGFECALLNISSKDLLYKLIDSIYEG